MVETKTDTLIAYCGLDCSRCFGYKKTISEAAKGLRRTMHDEKIKQVWPSIPFLGDYDSFKKTLDALAGFRCKSCREGGGPPWCKIRSCCQKRATIAAPNAMGSSPVKSSPSWKQDTRMST